MDSVTAIKVNGIAEEVRNWTELLAMSRGCSENDDLNGFCAIASAELHKRLTAAGIDCEMRLTSGWHGSHVYVVVQDYIIDVTATQFSEFANQTIVIMHEKELEHLWYYQEPVVFHSRTSLKKLQVRNDWPQEQIIITR